VPACVESELIILLAGPMAELRAQRRRVTETLVYTNSDSNPNRDLVRVKALREALSLTSDHNFWQYLLQEETKKLLRHRATWRAVERMKDLLVELRYLSGDQVEQICRNHRVPSVRLAADPATLCRCEACELRTASQAA
jgi:hypothetical protein